MGDGISEVIDKHLENIENCVADGVFSFPMAGNERLICLLVKPFVDLTSGWRYPYRPSSEEMSTQHSGKD
jgi:hypothetical protein